ncbi:MAG: glycosyltransferase [Planctomycetota bacterium]
MRIRVLAIGTRGDVQPYVALSKALIARGHDVRIGGPDNFASWVEGHGVGYVPLGFDMQVLLDHPLVKRLMSGNPFVIPGLIRRVMLPMLRTSFDKMWEAARDAEVIVYHPKATTAMDIAEATGAVAICASPIPLYPTGDFLMPVFPGNLGRPLNRLSYRFMSFSRAPFRAMINRWRREVLGLSTKSPWIAPLGWTHRGMGMRLCCVSPSVMPEPGDWDDQTHMTGYWFLDEAEAWEPDAELAAFLEAGERPVYIGFGSMTDRSPERITREVIDGVQRAGVRAILAKGWGALDPKGLPDGMYAIDHAPHAALFQRVSAVVHHGGAGTTAAGLRACQPTLICPQVLDQPFWGRRVHALGCGPEAMPLRRLRADRFAAALSQLTGEKRYRERAEEVGEAIRGEDGVSRAVALIEGSTAAA